jgi:hypothetical protein
VDVIFWNGGIAWKAIMSRYIGPYKVAHWLRKHGYDCQVIDHITTMTEDQLYRATTKFITNKTLAIGISSTFLTNAVYTHSNGKKNRIPENALNVLKRIRSEYPDVKVIIGGYMSDRVPGWGVMDVTVMSYTGASEDIFLEYIDHLRNGSEPPIGEFQPVWGNTTRMIYDRARNPKYNIETDDFRFVPQDVILRGEVLPLDVSRGCIFACKFCQFPHLGKKKLDYVRHSSMLEDEIRYNQETFGSTRYYVLDDTFNDTEWKMREFYDLTQRLDFKIDYVAYLRADLINRFPDTAHMLKESGLFGGFHGIETLHPSASKLVGKGWSGTHAREYIPKLYHEIWKGEVAQHLSFIVGLPGETEEDVHKTYHWFVENKLHSCDFKSLGLFGPGNSGRYTIQSEFDKNAEKYGFTFVDDTSIDGGQRRWKNDQWTVESAVRVSSTLNKLVKPITKLGMWGAIPMLWYGWSRQDLLTLPVNKLPWKSASERTQLMYQIYYNNLMNL